MLRFIHSHPQLMIYEQHAEDTPENRAKLWDWAAELTSPEELILL